MTAPILYTSSDASAPQLTGQTGQLNVVLKAILVDGYGAKASAGWTRDYSDATTQTSTYRPLAGPRHYLQVQDNGPGVGTFKEARIRAYETMSAYNTGTNPFPTVAQMASGLFIRKSATTDATSRPWIALADDKTLNFFIQTGDNASGYEAYAFGAFVSWKPSDTSNTLVTGRLTENSASITYATSNHNYISQSTAVSTDYYIARAYNGLAGGTPANWTHNSAIAPGYNQSLIGSQGRTYPYPIDGGLMASQQFVQESGLIRGRSRGIWIPGHIRPLLQDDTFTATDGATTRTFRAVNIFTTGQLFLETSNTIDID